MSIIVGLILLVLMVILFGLLEIYTANAFDGNSIQFSTDGVSGFIVILMLIVAGMIGWELNEEVMYRVFELRYRENFFTRVLQVLQTIMVVLIAYRGFALGLVVYFLIMMGVFFNWLISG